MLPTDTLWAINRSHLESLRAALPNRLTHWPTAQQIAEFRAAQGQALRAVKGKVAVLPLYGTVEQRQTAMSWFDGGVATEDVGAALQALLDHRDCEAIVLDVDSPGGTVYGVQELADQIFAARASKPIVAVANSMACSAAYWIATAAGTLAMTPGGDVGSVGVYCMHVDQSEGIAAEGVKVTIVKAGKYKAEMSQFSPLSEEALDYLQAQVNDTYASFVKAVARNRGVQAGDVRDNYGQGRTVGAKAALAAGMVDRVATLGEVLGKLLGGGPAAGKVISAASTEVLRLRQARQKEQAARWLALR